MAYTPTTWVDGTTPVNAANLNKIEQALDATDQAAIDAQADAAAAASAAAAAQATADAAQPEAEKGQVNGYASLDAGGKVPLAQLPPVGADVSYGTTLPASPVDGQEAILVDSLTAPTYQWRFRYNASSTSPYKWEFVGGAAYRAVVSANEQCNSTTPVDLATVGPSFIAPRNGEYHGIGSAMMIQQNTTQQTNCGLQVAALNITAASATGAVVGNVYSVSASGASGPVTAGQVLKMLYYRGSAAINFQLRQLTIWPVRVS